jgi:hypothetical protein
MKGIMGRLVRGSAEHLTIERTGESPEGRVPSQVEG